MQYGTALDQGGFDWRKSSFSGGQNGNCIEVGRTPAGTIPVRDTKQHGCGPILEFAPAVFRDFVNAIKAGEFPVQR
ncbi:DUF397 domain-containing protein [Kitasatospora sp. RB6PN24]|uniref:DUF397 domain-containing protein n=1 Tax=Kitasatospora humi TaxID=2893891 RepID=UPI001E40B933|nr:DUF397 domain-containing protein [Kitasatospora humi]MCC9307306.1 DUF397 domain-containing protein [Kitasatospora humi]